MSGAKPPDRVFEEDQKKKDADGDPEFGFFVERKLAPEFFGRLEIVEDAERADADQRRDGGARNRRHRGGDGCALAHGVSGFTELSLSQECEAVKENCNEQEAP